MRVEAKGGAGVSGLRSAIPIVTAFVAALIMLLPIGSGVDGITMPHLVLVCVFYWLSHRPMLVPYGACLGIGIFLDLWLGVPLGLNALMLILARVFVLNQLKFYRGRNRILYWLVFSLIALALFALSWVIVSLIAWQIVPPIPVLVQWLVTSLAYIPSAYFLSRFRRSVV